MNKFEKKIDLKLGSKWQIATPSLRIQAFQNGRKKVDLAYGDYYPFYDLASLTKVIFTGRAIMHLIAQKKLKTADRVHSILAWWPHSQTTIKQLLTHSSGMIWWKPFYEDLRLTKPNAAVRFLKLAQTLAQTPLEKHEKCIYSDSGFLLLAFILEKIFQKPLIEIFNEQFENWYADSELHFRNLFEKRPLQNFKYAPTEVCLWSNKILQGVVHDENARALGGVSTHAGLFGGVDDVSHYLLTLRKIYWAQTDTRKLPNSILQTFLKRAVPRARGDWTLGWMMPTQGVSSSGKYFSKSSVGHTGFTGTSIWWDIKKDIFVVILSNRVNLGRENKSFAQLRPMLHDFIIESLEG